MNKKMDVRIMSQDNVLTPIDTEINKVNRTGEPAYLRRSFRLWNHHGKSIGSTYLLGLPYRWNSFQGVGHCETSSVEKHNLIIQ